MDYLAERDDNGPHGVVKLNPVENVKKGDGGGDGDHGVRQLLLLHVVAGV